LGLTLLSVVLAAAAFLVARSWQARDAPSFQRLAAPESCDLRVGPCARRIGDGEVSFEIIPADIPLMRTLTLRVRTNQLEVAGTVVEIRGLNMDMGLNRTVLQRDQAGVWVGETILPLCSQRRMEWEAAVQLSLPTPVEVPFRFATRRR
jgi:hypothetical protein